MTRSMTAFARSTATLDQGRWLCELRAVNHRFLEVSVKLPEELRFLESAVRERLGRRLRRGKLECSFRAEAGAVSAQQLSVNAALVHALASARADVAAIVGEQSPPSAFDFLRWPGVIESRKEDAAQLAPQLLALLDAALEEFVQTRWREGAKLRATIEARCDQAAGCVERLRAQMPEILAAVRERLLGRLEELPTPLDPGRLEQELTLIAQRMDVAEELDRLEAHLGEVRRVLGTDEPVGRRLDFLMQELNREANTIGSKSSHIESTSVSMELKVLIEQMREQVQNIE